MDTYLPAMYTYLPTFNAVTAIGIFDNALLQWLFLYTSSLLKMSCKMAHGAGKDN